MGFTWNWYPVKHAVVRGIARSGGPDFMLGASTYWSTEFVSVEAGTYAQSRYVDKYFRQSYAPFAAISSPWLTSKSIDLNLNVAYDAYNDLPGAGVGLAYDFTQNHRLFAEYFPRFTTVSERRPDLGKKDSFGVGYRYHSFGHQYFLMLTNSKAVDLTQAIWGADSNDLGIAIRVNREM